MGILFSLPPVQNKLAKWATNKINTEFGTNINIDKVDLSFFGRVGLKGIYIEDHKKDTLVYIQELNTSLLSVRNAINNNLKFGTVNIEGLTFNLKTYEGEPLTNLDVFIAKLENPSDTISKSTFILTSSDVSIEESKFRLIDENVSKPRVLDFENLFIEVDDFIIEGPNVAGAIDELAFTTGRGIAMRRLQTQFSYTPQQMRFEDLSILTSLSDIEGMVVFDYKREDMADFINKVNITANFEQSEVSLDEINLFYNEFGANKLVVFSSEVEGVLNDFTAKNFDLESGNSLIKGDFHFQNIVTSSAPFRLGAEMENVTSSYDQLQLLLPDILGKSLPSSLKRLEQFTIRGNASVTEEKINMAINLYTGLGSSYADMELSNIGDIDNASYQGFVSFLNFDIGTFVNDKAFGRITSDFDVVGSGFTQKKLNTEITGKVFKLNYNDYDYRDLQVAGLLRDQLFDGKLVSSDPNAQFTFEGLADMSGAKNKFNFTADVAYADFKKLHFITTDSISIFKGVVNMNMTGNTIENLEGDINFLNTNYTNPNNTYSFDDFSLSSSFSGEERIIEINSPDIITGTVKGKFYLDEVGKLIENSIGSIYTNYSPHRVSEGQYMDFNLKIYNKIVEVFFPEIVFGKSTTVKGSMIADEGDFKLTFKSPYLSVYGNVFDDVKLRIDNKNPLFNTYVEVQDIDAGFYKIKDFNLINTTIKDTLFFRTEFKGGKGKEYNDIYNLNFYHTFNKDKSSVIGLKTSDVGFKGNKWVLNEKGNTKNKVVFNRTLDSITIEEIEMSLDDEYIRLQGELVDSTYKNIKLRFKDVALDKISPSIDSLSMEGILNGDMNILQQNKNYFSSSNLFIDDFTVNSQKLGKLTVGVIGDEDMKTYTVDANLTNNNLENLRIAGDARFTSSGPDVDLQLSLNDLDLSPFSPLGGEVLSNLKGYLSGNVAVIGNLKNPDMNGQLTLNGTGLNIPYLNVAVDFDDEANVKLYGQSFEFDNVVLTDTKYNTQSLLDGTITHTNFQDWFLDLKLNTLGEKFLVLNTEYDEDALYYGTGFISGEATISGFTNALNINVAARTEKGTSFKIPISDVTTIGDTSYIRFIDKNESEEVKRKRELLEYEGLELSFDLDVTPDAEVEIVIDRKTGSTLKGTGAGNLLIEINTNGKFRMWGDFITFTGIYNFKYRGLLTKELRVLPGGTITWDGDPLKANLNMEAVYSTTANPAILLDNNSITRKIDTDVVIKLEGELLQPTIDYDINFPNTNGVVVSELEYRLEDRNRRELQALSLLSQGTFIDEVSISQQALTGNLIETASSLINDILNDGDGKFDVGLSYEQGNRNLLGVNTQDRLGVTVSTQVSDRILINGKIGVPVGGVTESVVAGDVEVQILLNEDGSLSAKIFNKQNEIQQFLSDRQGYTQGIGLSYQVDFDTFRELFRKLFKKSEKKKEQEETPKRENIGNGLLNFSSKNKKASQD
ncbi:translocation/assembly module TamB domain-containing protein [Leptobacterium sp. I13]|uniref:translocation/assembly module TamB domain-containing protein n=1 Tax=Leptobacterium meishanense TaxID=3128904 RepID=UPI0030EF8257